MLNIRVFIFVLFMALSINLTFAQKNDKIKKIVLIPGFDSHGIGAHEFLGGTRLLAKLLNEYVPGVEAIVTEQGWPKDISILNEAATIVLYCDGGDEHVILPHMAHIEMLMRKGVGIVNLHYAVEIPKGEGGNNFLRWLGGYFELNYSVNPFWTPEIIRLPHHPITRGVQPFQVSDEWYYHLRFVENDKKLVQILEALPPSTTLDRPDGPYSNNAFVRESVLMKKEPQTIAWAYERSGGGRGFGFTGAHVHKNWMNDDFRKIVLNAIIWTSKIKVPRKGIITPTPSIEELNDLQKKEAVPWKL